LKGGVEDMGRQIRFKFLESDQNEVVDAVLKERPDLVFLLEMLNGELVKKSKTLPFQNNNSVVSAGNYATTDLFLNSVKYSTPGSRQIVESYRFPGVEIIRNFVLEDDIRTGRIYHCTQSWEDVSCDGFKIGKIIFELFVKHIKKRCKNIEGDYIGVAALAYLTKVGAIDLL
jgi:hypothetical protein